MPAPSAAFAAALRSAFNEAVRSATSPHVCSCPTDSGGYGPDSWFDRSICPEPCGSMHNVCNDCGRIQGRCPHADATDVRRSRVLAAVAPTLITHAPDDGGVCVGCPDLPAWPCEAAMLAALVVDPDLVDYEPLSSRAAA